MYRGVYLLIVLLLLSALVYAIPLTDFDILTPANNTFTSNRSIQINFSITESRLGNLTYGWNGTNYTYYNNSLIFMANFDNVSNLGENDTNVLEFSQNLENGTWNGSLSGFSEYGFNLSGKFGGAFRFDGKDDFLNFSSIAVPSGNITVSLWARLDDDTVELDHDLIFGRWGHNAGGFAVFRDSGGNNIHWTLSNGFGLNRKWDTDNDVLTEGNWHHVVTTGSAGSSPSANIYVDGILQSISLVDSGNLVAIAAPSFDGMVGYDVADKSGYFNGSVDEIMVWDRVLTDGEIQQLYFTNIRKFDSDKWSFYVNQTKNVSDLLDEGPYDYFLSAVNSSGSENKTLIRKINMDNTIPVINITYPINNTNYTSSDIDINYTYTEINTDSCWYSNDTYLVNTTITCGANISSISWSNALHNITLWMNDSAGNVNSTSMSFRVDVPETVSASTASSTNSGGSASYIRILKYLKDDFTLRSYIYEGDRVSISLNNNFLITKFELTSKHNLGGDINVTISNDEDFCNIYYDNMYSSYNVIDFNSKIDNNHLEKINLELKLPNSWIIENDIKNLRLIDCFGDNSSFNGEYLRSAEENNYYSFEFSRFSKYILVGFSDNSEKDISEIIRNKIYNEGDNYIYYLYLVIGLIIISLLIIKIRKN